MLKIPYRLYKGVPRLNFGGLIYSTEGIFYRTKANDRHNSFTSWVRNHHTIRFLFTFKYYVLV